MHDDPRIENALPEPSSPETKPVLTCDAWLEAACAAMAALDQNPERLAELTRRGF